MGSFSKVVPYLTHPLVLTGFVLLLFFAVHKTLIKSGIIPPLSKRSGNKILKTLLRYGFILALLVIILGFALEFFKTASNNSAVKERINVLVKRTEEVLGHAEKGPAAESFRTSTMIQKDQEKVKRIISEVEKILKNKDVKADADDHYQIGMIYLNLGEYEKAIVPFLAAIKLEPEMGKAYLKTAIAYQLKASDMAYNKNYKQAEIDIQKAERYVKVALQYDATDPSVHVQLGYVYRDLAQMYKRLDKSDAVQLNLQKAESHLKMAIGIDVKNAGAYNGLGSIYFVNGKYDEAIEQIKKAIQLSPSYLFAYHDLAITYFKKAQRVIDAAEQKKILEEFQKTFNKIVLLDGTPGAGKLSKDTMDSLKRIATHVNQMLSQ